MKRYKAFLAILLIGGVFSVAGQASEQTFNEPIFYNPAGYYFSFGAAEDRTASIAAGDVNGDGAVDVVIANGRHWPAQNEIFLNSGEKSFTVSYPLGYYRSTTYAAELADLDGDGDLDIVTGNDEAPNRIFLNDGEGNFTEGGNFGAKRSPTRNLLVTDLDSDGDIDIVVVNRGAVNEICFNDGTGKFDTSTTFGGESSTIDVDAADMDGDGDIDLVLANRDGQQNFILLQEAGKFSHKVPFGTGSDETRSVALADFSGDGLIDIATGNIGQPNRLYLARKIDSELDFSIWLDLSSSTDSSATYSIDAADFDGDGDIDIAVGNSEEPNEVFVNMLADGQQKLRRPSFHRQRLSEQAFDTYKLRLVDLNNDGFPDLVEANSDGLNLYYFNLIPFRK